MLASSSATSPEPPETAVLPPGVGGFADDASNRGGAGRRQMPYAEVALVIDGAVESRHCAC